MKKTFIILCSISIVLISCNSSGNSAGSTSKPTDTASSTTTTTVSPTAEKGLELIGASDCTTCHRLKKESTGATIGPAYSDVAAKYAPAADTTVNRLVAKIISGGSGVWGAVPMTPHPALAQADVKVMVNYILSLKK